MLHLTELVVALGSVLILAGSSLLWKLAAHRRRFKDLPKPPHSFLFGHLLLFFNVARQLPKKAPIAIVISRIQTQYQLPDLFYLDMWPVTGGFMVTGDRTVANQFLNDYPRHPLVLKEALQPLVGGNRGLVSPDLSEWHSSRTTMRSVFSIINVQRFVPTMAQYSMQLRKALLQRAKAGKAFPMIEPIEKWGADLTFCYLLGEDTGVQKGGWGAEANAQVQELVAQADHPFSVNPWINYQQKQVRSRCQDRVRQMIQTALVDALKRDKPVVDGDFLALIDSIAAKYREEYPGRTEWDADMLAQHVDTLATLFLAADVSSMVLTYVFCHIAQDPKVAAELRKEHNAVFPGDAQATLDALSQSPSKIKELSYTTAVIKESMRLRPPGLSGTTAPNGHTVNFKGTEHALDGFFLFTNLIRLQSNDAYTSSPLAFDPTRWLPQPSTELADSWRPFQRGQHSCMGENMMMPGLVTALLMTVRDVDVALAYDPGDLRLSPELGGAAYMEGNFAAKPAKGLPVMVTALAH
ncbi:cytochrome P450 [Stipitochalara longipes BDJ]|nr:cytochrome P450 [Stipitochalara longipes BDJ]